MCAVSCQARPNAAASSSGTRPARSQARAGPTIAPLPVGPHVALKQVVSQGSEETVPKLSANELSQHWDRVKAVCGREPRPEEECTGEQLTGVYLLLNRDCASYNDFGVWGPDHQRLLKNQLHAGGVLKNIELSEPPDAETWSESCKLLCAALIGFGAVSLGPLMGPLATSHGLRRKVRCSNLAAAVSDGSQMQTRTHGKIAASPRTRMCSGNNTRPSTDPY